MYAQTEEGCEAPSIKRGSYRDIEYSKSKNQISGVGVCAA